jgi:charged multivesicular body protein 7
MEALAEANVDAKEIDDAIRVGADVAVGVVDAVNEEELEEEWKAMVRELESEKEIKKEEQRQKLEEAATPQNIPVQEKLRAMAVAVT